MRQTLLNFKFLNEPIVKRFLADPKNQQLFQEVTENPNEQNHLLLDRKFKVFYKKVRMLKYFSTMIRISSIDFDKRDRKIKQRFLLTLDAPLNNEEEKTSRIETIPDSVEDPFTTSCVNLAECITDPALYQTYSKLNNKQKKILNLMYIEGLIIQDIATFLGDSKQNINNIHKRSLSRLKSTTIFKNQED
ncbi:sigma factor-like helix-turn-helix DNA-binding protein [Bacillus altitudinis]|uniref:sigma factor-like helix-turn-helix DNA-binding protein n=1 Tax=Bacillus altitudinis TaxID=293387 RepID=UPI00227FDAE2|nr:sigma factor-like helix-turn-helix DNA-binding protein [Bacillus altitudinis]MCY7631253.1 RNA polymerase subunit sigma-70 [Bacillus altitudinis]MDX2366006.1 RNA polymerase subunit sigma-70 [Bacillus altitudinis]